MSGKLEKLTIVPYTDHEYNTVAGEPYVALINPDEIVEDYKVEYHGPETDGRVTDTKLFKNIKAPKFSVKLLFDSTGVLEMANSAIASAALSAIGGGATLNVADATKSTGGTVAEQVKKFREVTGDFVGEIHRPSFVKIFWGDIVFAGVLVTFKLKYTLFSPDGKPMRGIGEAIFEESFDSVTKKKKANESSPDLTHIRTVNNGDTLPLMCERIYKNPKLYLQVARVNGLSNYRKLEVGSKLFFPPIKDQA